MSPRLLLACVFGLLAVCSVAAQPNTPSTYNRAGAHLDSTNPCADINVQFWQDVPSNRVTVDPNFNEGVTADYASVWTGHDNLNLFPNGFRKGQVYEDNNPPFCFKVNNVKNKKVQVMLQTTDDQAALCIKDTTSTGSVMSGTLAKCFVDKTIACFSSSTNLNELTLMVFTSSSAATTSTPFWYRVRVSEATWSLQGSDTANSAIQTLEMWCMMQDQLTDLMKFPKELRSVVPPDSVVIVPQGSAATQSASILAVVTLAAATLAAVFRL